MAEKKVKKTTAKVKENVQKKAMEVKETTERWRDKHTKAHKALKVGGAIAGAVALAVGGFFLGKRSSDVCDGVDFDDIEVDDDIEVGEF